MMNNNPDEEMNESHENNSDEKTKKSEEILSDEQQIILDSVSVPQKVNIKIKNATSISEDARQMNEAFELARIMYQDVLSPQLQKNEDLKRQQKESLMNELFKILNLQFKYTYLFVLILIIGTLTSSYINISEDTIQHIFKFVEYYVTSIVVELLSILFFIVKNVFDTSIVDLIKNFDKRNRKNKKNIKKRRKTE